MMTIEVWDEYCTKPKKPRSPPKPRVLKPRHFEVECESWWSHNIVTDGTIVLSLNFKRGRLSAPTYNPMKRLVGRPGTTVRVKQWEIRGYGQIMNARTPAETQETVMIGPFTITECRTNHNGTLTMTYKLDP